MNSANERVEILLDAALELPGPAERAALLDRECAGDAALRARVERLLAAHQRSEKFFADCQSAWTVAGLENRETPAPALEEETGKRIGPYKLLQKIGEGGCGVVYMAEQEKPVRRRVALKIIKLGMDTKSVIARFEAERQALAMMDHPNIARVLDAGATETGRPYFVMELVHGVRITEYCDQKQLDTQQRLELFIQVCHAIQHAHQKGIIHRDIKPSNILVTLHDGAPVPKVIDFGIAKAMAEKLTDKTLFTMYGNFIGTPAYMSPEQAELSGLDIDTRSDIYSLGVLLYELLTGRTPFDQQELLAAGLDEMRRTLREREPHRPSTKLDTLQTAELTATALRRHVEPPKLQLLLKGDLDWIVMRALEKDRRRRYETANGLAMDVRRYLDNEPILARPPSRRYRFQKLVRRNRVLFAAGGMVVLALVAGLGTATWMFLQEREMRHRAVAAEQQAEQARATEAELRRQAETREKIAQAAFLISQGKLPEADAVAAGAVFREPTLEGAAVLRTLGQWQALNGRWSSAAARLVQAVQVDQLDSAETIARDFLQAGVVLAAAGDTNRFEWFRRDLVRRFAEDRKPPLADRMLKAALLLPAGGSDLEFLQPLAHSLAPAAPASIGNPQPSDVRLPDGAGDFLREAGLHNIGTQQPHALQINGNIITVIAGGANIWETNDAFAFACAPVVGDFDFRMRVRSLSPVWDPFTRVGLMARESLDQVASRHVMVAVNANNTFQVVTRSEAGAMAESLPQNPLPATYGSNSWVRLQRVGAIFHAYIGTNGVDWMELYAAAGRQKPFNNLVYFGIAASSHSATAVTTNVVSDFGPTPAIAPNSALTLALLDYRRGRFASSAAWCRRLLNYPECNPVQGATAQVMQALACWQLNRRDEAGRWLAQAREVIDKQCSTPLAEGDKADGFWFDWIAAQVLLQEAEAAIH